MEKKRAGKRIEALAADTITPSERLASGFATGVDRMRTSTPTAFMFGTLAIGRRKNAWL